MSRSTGILCDWLNNSQTRYSPIRVFPQQLSNRQIGSSSNIKLRVQEGLNELGIVLLCPTLGTMISGKLNIYSSSINLETDTFYDQISYLSNWQFSFTGWQYYSCIFSRRTQFQNCFCVSHFNIWTKCCYSKFLSQLVLCFSLKVLALTKSYCKSKKLRWNEQWCDFNKSETIFHLT